MGERQRLEWRGRERIILRFVFVCLCDKDGIQARIYMYMSVCVTNKGGTYIHNYRCTCMCMFM